MLDVVRFQSCVGVPVHDGGGDAVGTIRVASIRPRRLGPADAAVLQRSSLRAETEPARRAGAPVG